MTPNSSRHFSPGSRTTIKRSSGLISRITSFTLASRRMMKECKRISCLINSVFADLVSADIRAAGSSF